MGRTNNVEAPILTSTVRTSPSLPRTTLTTRSIRHCPLGNGSSTRSTISPTSTFRRGLCHFSLSCKAGIYSFNHLFQKCSAKICVCRHFFLTRISSFTKDPGGKVWTVRCSNRWLGVKGSQSFGSSEAGESGLEFKIDSTSVRTVVNTSSSTRPLPRIAFRAVRVLRISLSQTPLACEAFGGWNTYWHPLCSSSSWICFWFQFSMAVVISLSALTKLDPLSE